MVYDVIVVGAGPAGSTTARECASRGLSVLLLDRAAFPRDKPCGGGVMVRAARLLPFDLKPVIERSISGIQFSFRRHHSFIRDFSQPLAYLTQRSRLDLFLVEQAVKAGAVLREREPVREIERSSSRVKVRTGSEIFEARTLVAADGANGQTVKRAGLRVDRWCFVAMEVNVNAHGPVPELWQNRMGVDMGDVPGGYHWVFPKGDHLNIGVGGVQSSAASFKRLLREVVRFHGFDSSQQWGLASALLPVRKTNALLVDGNLLIVGDAAGLVEPLTGEGIYSAIWSGQAAARNLAAFLDGQMPDLQGYRRDIENGLIPDLKVAFQLWNLYHFIPSRVLAFLLRQPDGTLSDITGWTRLARLFRGDDKYQDFKKDLGPLWSFLNLFLRSSAVS